MQSIENIDISILEFIRNNINSFFLDNVMVFISTLGDYGIIWIAAALAFLFLKKDKACGGGILISLALSGLIGNLFLKTLIARERPFTLSPELELLIAPPTDYSFPSGHTLSSFAAATVMFRHNKKIGGCAYALVTAMAFSRLYLYVHYPTDILAGIILGIGIGFAAVFLWNKIKIPKNRTLLK